MTLPLKLIIGLENPGAAYEQTRHNAGGWFVRLLAKHHGATWKADKKLKSNIADLKIDNLHCRLALPMTYMNHSGQSVQALANYYRLKPEEILVAHDELDLMPGRIKLKSSGGHGGHNGLRDTINMLGSQEFHRLRIGIGHPGHRDLVHNYVLGKPSLEDRQFIMDALERGLVIIPDVIRGQMAKAMNQLN
jgi:PTH1 family peptidyl-tRNA hydrolase